MRQTANLIPVVALVLCACTASSSEPLDDVEVADGKADGATLPLGAYWHDGAEGEELAELMLFPDKTFVRVASWDYDSMRLRGTYKLTRWEDRTYIRFYDNHGELYDRYRYYMNGSVLKVRESETASSTGPYQPLFTEATGKDAWTLAVKLDWFDNWFDIDVEVWSHTDINPSDLPAGANATYAALVQEFGSNSVDLYEFTAHGRSGFEISVPDQVLLLDDAGATVATGTGAGDFFDFEWK